MTNDIISNIINGIDAENSVENDVISVNDIASDNRHATWHGIGKDISNCRNVSDLLYTAGLDYLVSKSEVFTDDGTQIPGVSATVADDGHIFGIVSNKYTVVQNEEAFSFMNEIPDMKFVKAGMTYTCMVYVIGELPTVRVLDDNFKPYVIVQNGFNGKYNIKATICPLRIVCQNQFAYAFRNSENTVSIRHSSLAESKLADARNTLIASANAMSAIATDAERFAGMPVNDIVFYHILNELFSVDEDASDKVKDTVALRKNAFIRAYEANDNTNYRGTAWGVINAYADYLTHITSKKVTDKTHDNRFLSVTFNNNAMNKLMSMLVA